MFILKDNNYKAITKNEQQLQIVSTQEKRF